MMAPRTMAGRSADTTWLVQELLKVEPHHTVTYAALSAGLHRDVQSKARGNLRAARKIVEREECILFDVVINVGLVRVGSLGVVHIGQRARKHIGRAASRTVRRLATCAKREDLSEADRVQYDVTAATMGIVAHVTRPATQKRLEGKITPAMPTAETMRALNEAL